MQDLIGLFDSGVGGISVLHTVHQLLPHENLLYYGDNRNAPYGTRSLEQIRALCEQGIGLLLERGVKAIVIACNTATSAYAEILRAKVDLPVIGMEPAVKPAQLARHGGEILVLATRATLSLPKFKRLMSQWGTNVTPIVGEGLVELVEAGMANTPQADRALERLLAPYRDHQIDSIVLGCTHYPFLEKSVRKVFPDAAIFDGREGTALQLKHLLEQRGLLSDDAPGTVEIHTSGGSDTLMLMQRLLDML